MSLEIIRPIKSEADYDSTLPVIDNLMGASANTPESDELEILVTLVEAYEAKHWPMEPPEPIAVIEHVMDARGFGQNDFAELIGSQPRASEVLNRRRPLTLSMIRALSAKWNVPADILVCEYEFAITAWRISQASSKRCKTAKYQSPISLMEDASFVLLPHSHRLCPRAPS